MAHANPAVVTKSASAKRAKFKLTCPDIVHDNLAAKHFLSASYEMPCSGGNVSPRLCWQGTPVGTKTLILMLHDRDAPTGDLGWMHWVVINIPNNATELPQGVSVSGHNLPIGALQTLTDFGTPWYGGPCPPKAPEKPHRYCFTLYAMKNDLKLGANAMPARVAYHALGDQCLGKAKLEIKLNR